MATAQTTVQQYEPLRPPSSWTAEERKLVQQLTDRFDDLYSRFNRLRFEDLGTKMQDQILAKVNQDDYTATLALTADGLNAVLERTGALESALKNDVETKDAANKQYTKIEASATGLSTLIGTAVADIANAKTGIEALNGFRTEQETYIRQDIEGVHVGKSNYKAETLVATDGLHIRDNTGTECANFTDNKSLIKNAIITNTLQIGGFQYIKFSTGRMSIKWVG